MKATSIRGRPKIRQPEKVQKNTQASLEFIAVQGDIQNIMLLFFKFRIHSTRGFHLKFPYMHAVYF
jgi:hypothetical protein